MKRCILSFFIIINFSISVFGQNLSYRKNKYVWKDNKPKPIAVDPQFAGEDAVILDEDCRYNFFYTGEVNFKTPGIHKHVRIKFLTEEGIRNYSTFLLPESFDPQHDRVILPPEKRKIDHRPMGEFECISHFAARIIKNSGIVKEANFTDSITKRVFTRDVDQTYYNWFFKITNLEPGDELELDYIYEGAFMESPSSKIFFDGSLPKQNYKLTFVDKLSDYFMVLLHDTGYVDTSYTKIDNKYREHIYVAHNLKGGINECGSRAIQEKPFISYYFHNYKYGDYGNSAVVTNPLPFPWWFVLRARLSYQKNSLSIYLMKTDKTTIAVNNFVSDERFKIKIKNPAISNLMAGIQHTINTEFDYKNDIDYIEGKDTKLEKMGLNVMEKKLRYMSRHHFYYEIFLRLDTEYFLGIVPDKRNELIDPNIYEKVSLFDDFYVLRSNNRTDFYYPKGSRFGYEANEFPFYYEDVIVSLANQHLPASLINDINPDIEYPFVKTPSSSAKDNSRQTTMLIEASLDSLNFKVTGRLTLSGQFSTLTRGYYLYGAKDTTINSYYYKSIKDLNDAGQQIEVVNKSIDNFYPFVAAFNYSFRKNKFITKEKENEYSFSLNGWFNNVIEEDYNCKIRHLSYYPDFESEDFHKLMIKFDYPVQLLRNEELNDTISNSYGQYITIAEQKDDRSILIQTFYAVNSAKVSPGEFKNVSTIFDAIKDWNKHKFIVKRL